MPKAIAAAVDSFPEPIVLVALVLLPLLLLLLLCVFGIEQM